MQLLGTASLQTSRSNIQCEDVEQYYRISMFLPFVDHLIQCLNERFGKTQKSISLACKLVPSVLIQHPSMADAGELDELIEAFPDIQSKTSFSSEYERWCKKWTDSKEEAARCTGFAEAYANVNVDLFPDIAIVLQVHIFFSLRGPIQR